MHYAMNNSNKNTMKVGGWERAWFTAQTQSFLCGKFSTARLEVLPNLRHAGVFQMGTMVNLVNSLSLWLVQALNLTRRWAALLSLRYPNSNSNSIYMKNKRTCLVSCSPEFLYIMATRAQLLEAWLALTSVKYLDNVLVLILLNQWLKLTMLWATQPRVLFTSNNISRQKTHSPHLSASCLVEQKAFKESLYLSRLAVTVFTSSHCHPASALSFSSVYLQVVFEARNK